MGQQVPLSEIRTTRTLEPGDDITKLAESIRESGLQIPILLDNKSTLIDGLRRLKAVTSLGYDTIEVVAVNLYEQAMAWIKRAREHGAEARPMGPRRTAELYQGVRPLLNVSRSYHMRGTRHGAGVHLNGRESFLDATGITSTSHFQAITQFFKLAAREDAKGQYAREMLSLVENQTITPYMGLDYIRRRTAEGNVTKLEDQRLIVMNTRAALTGLLYSLQQLGPLDPGIGQDEDGLIEDLRKMRRILHQLINQLNKEKTQ